MSDNSLKQKTVNGFFWQLMQRIICQLISFAVTVVLARLLVPEDYGLVALAGMFMTLIGVFTDTGIGTALVQKKNPDDLDYNTVFYSNFVISFFTYALIFILAPYFADWYEKPEATSVIRVLALSAPIGALTGVQGAFVKKQMIFQKLFVVTLSGSVVSAIVGLTLAYLDYGVWALVGQSLSATIINSIVMFFIVSWHPKFQFSLDRFKSLFSFGWRMTIVNIINTFSYQLKGYAIGLKYSASDLAYYNRGEGLPGILVNNINGSITSVLFPALSKLQDDPVALKRAISRSIRISCFFLMPALFGLAAMSDRIIILLYTDKWASAIPFMQIICLISCSDIIGAANYQALMATGKVKTLMKLEYIKRPLMIGLVLVSMMISPFAIVVSMLLYSVTATIVNAYPNKKYINYSFLEQAKDVGGSFYAATLMAIGVYVIGQFKINDYICIPIQLFVGACLYFTLSYLLNRNDLLYVYDFIKQRVKREA